MLPYENPRELTDSDDSDEDDSDPEDDDDSKDEADLDAADGADDDKADALDIGAEMTQLRSQVAGLSDIIAARASSDAATQRQLGQVKGNQAAISKLEEAAGKTPTEANLASLNTVVTTLVEAMADDLPAAARERISAAQAEGRQGDAIAEALRALKAETPVVTQTDEQKVEPAGASEQQLASVRVIEYAAGKGIDQSELMEAIPQSEWVTIQRASNSWAVAVTALKAKVDGLVEAKASSRRRDRRSAEGTKGGDPPKSGTGKALPSKSQLAKMNLTQVMEISSEDRQKILAS